MYFYSIDATMQKKKNIICFILWGIVIFLLFCLWYIKLTTVKESFELFDNAWTDIGKKAWNAGKSAGSFIGNNTSNIFITNQGPHNDNNQYKNMGDVAHMRSQQSTVNYLGTLAKPSTVDIINMVTFNPDVFSGDRLINVGDQNTTGLSPKLLNNADFNLNDIAIDILNDNKTKIDWNKVFVDTTNTGDNTINVIKQPNASPGIIADACSTKGFLNSNFKEDICTVVGPDSIRVPNTAANINKKCQELSPENCSIPSCCVLINGNTCSSGSITGPTYLTQDGQVVDFTYYYYKKKCYGTGCGMAKEYEAACNKYDNNSTNVSKDCMIKMFNVFGCPNPSPVDIINPTMVQSYSLSSRKYVSDYLKTAVGILKYKIAQTKDPESLRICNGDPKIAPKITQAAPSGPQPVESLDQLGGAINTGLDTVKF